MQFIDLKTSMQKIEARLLERCKAVLNHGAYIMGPEMFELEQTLATFVHARHCISVASGTDALLIALMALDINAGDEVITTPFSFFATAEVIALLGATPVFVDIDPNTYNLDANLLDAAITTKTKAIMPVNLYGQCADYDAINQIAAKYQLPVVEDAAQSFGATYKGRFSCNLTTIGCTSFFPSKPLGCFGDGGACFTNDDKLAERMLEIRHHGQAKRYQHTRLGVNGRFDTMQAAFLLEKLVLFPQELELRNIVAARYQEGLNAVVQTPQIKEYNTSAYAQYTINVADRDIMQKMLQEQGIPTAIHYPLGLHEQPIFKTMYANIHVFPHTESAASRVLSLPMHPYLSLQDQQRIIDAIVVACS